MKIIVICTLIVGLTLIIGSCRRCKDEELKLTKTQYTGSEIRIDGYYHSTYDSSNKIVVMVFFSNGTMCSKPTSDTTLADIESHFIDGSFYNSCKIRKWVWGLYRINNNSIEIEGWKIQQCSYPAVRFNGVIENDSTITTGNYAFRNLPDYTYHFKEFAPKPDSTNEFL